MSSEIEDVAEGVSKMENADDLERQCWQLRPLFISVANANTPFSLHKL